MAPQSSQTTGLNLEDFRRLGIRPHEYRLTVIRRAAIRSARTLAEQQLTTPTTQTGVQLSRVATSTYRLLDPRKRRETAHRAYVGRILPQALSWAGQTNFHNELSGFGSTAGEMGKLPFERSSLSDAELIELLDLDSPPKSKHHSKQNWANSLSDADLLQTTPLIRRVARWNARSRFRWLALAAAGLVFGATLSFATHRWLGAEPAYASLAGDVATPDSDATSQMPKQNVQPLSAATTDEHAVPTSSVTRTQLHLVPDEMRELLPDEMRELLPDEMRELLAGETRELFAIEDAAESSSHHDQTLSESDQEYGWLRDLPQSHDQVNVLPDGMNVTLSNQESLNPALSSPDESKDAASQVIPSTGLDAESSTASLASGLPATLPDPFAPSVDFDLEEESVKRAASAPKSPAQDTVTQDTVTQGTVTQDTGEQDTGEQDTSASTVATSGSWPNARSLGLGGPHRAGPRRVSVPSQASQRTARRELIELMPQLDMRVEAENARSRIKDLELIERQYKIGSPEHWVVRTWIAEAAWLFEAVGPVEERLSSLVTLYDVSPEQLLAASFVASTRHASLPSTRDHLMDNGLRLADQLLLASEPAECKHVVEALLPFVSKLPGEDEPLRQYLRDCSDAANLMTRQADVVERVRGQSGQPPAADRTVLGQHYCLMLRRWDEGLEWLSDSYDRRIARVARQELQLGDTPTADGLKDVGEQWLATAARADGRAADSMRLHAIDLLRKAQPKAEALTKLEIDRKIDDATLLVPPHLVPLPGAPLGSLRGSRGRHHVPPTPGIPFF